MSTTTTKFGLVKPELTDPADITKLNPNWDTIDEELGKLVDANYLPKSGGTVTGTLVLSKVADSEGDSYNSPALIVGGEPTTYHLELDNNEIQAKLNKTTPGNLFLNSNGGKVTVGEGGLENGGDFLPTKALNSNIGTATLPWNRIYGRYLDLCGATDSLYGRFRVTTTGTETTDGVTTLTLGNETASGTANNASGKITMYCKGTGFTNILPKSTESGSNTVYLPNETGTLMLDTNGCRIASGSYSGTNVGDRITSLSSLQSSGRKITFPFEPKLVIFYASGSVFNGTTNMTTPQFVNYQYDILFGGQNKMYSQGSTKYYTAYLNGSTLYVGTTRDTASATTYYGHNVSGTTYNWVAIG